MTDKISRERLKASPGVIYTETVLEPSHRFMVAHYFEPLLETNWAWTLMLLETQIISREIGTALLQALSELEREGASAITDFQPNLEYFYSHVENFLIQRVGEHVAGEINIGRTRPEPLARMLLRRCILSVLTDACRFRQTLLDLAVQETETLMPQWTHFQPAQPSTLGHYLHAVEGMLGRDCERLLAAYANTNQCTLGCGALAGTSYPIDRKTVAELLGFDGVRENTIDCVSSADYVVDIAWALTSMMMTCSRLSQDLYIWHTSEFSLVEISDEFAGSSSLMPQKKNPYPFECVRAWAGGAIGDLASILAILHNTNIQDTKDVEEGVIHPVLRIIGDSTRTLRLLDGSIRTMEFSRDAMRRAASAGFSTATELAAVIHRSSDLSYRTAHRIVGTALRIAADEGRPELTADLVNRAALEIIGRDLGIKEGVVKEALDPAAFMAAHDVPGGPASQAMRDSLVRAKSRLMSHKKRRADLGEKLEDARARLNERGARVMAEGN